jgi:hypothetical protein
LRRRDAAPDSSPADRLSSHSITCKVARGVKVDQNCQARFERSDLGGLFR